MWSVWLQALLGAVCTAYLAMPAEQQAALLGYFGIVGEGAPAAASFFAQVNIAFTAATIGARAYKQRSLEADERGPAA
jgi:hypothetical protein